MIPQIIPRIRMNQRTQRPPPNHQPTHKSPKLLRRKNINLKHANRMRAKRPLKHRVNSQLRELASDPLVQVFGVLRLRGRGLLKVDVDVEAAARVVRYGGGERGVGGGFGSWWGVDVGFCVGARWGA
jgi:hypothetical protein